MLCKKDQQQENRNIDDLPPLHDVEEPLNNDTGNYHYTGNYRVNSVGNAIFISMFFLYPDVS